jgi:hypothetical protein
MYRGRFGPGFGGVAMPDRAWNDLVVAEPPPLELPDVDEPIVEPDLPKQQFQRQNEANIVNPIWQRDNPGGFNDMKQLDDIIGPVAVPAPPPDEERRLRQEGNFAAILVKHMNRRVELPPVADPSFVREYAHRRGDKQNDARAEPAPTIFWQPVLVMPDGKAELTFDLADAVTRYDVLVLSHTFDGRIGANRSELTTKLPVAVNPRAPTEIGDKDKLTIPVDVANNEGMANDATLWAKGKGLQFTDITARDLKLKANEKTRQLWQASPSFNEGTANFKMNNKTQGFAEIVERRLTVVPDGFPVTGSFSGVIEGNAVEHTINLPEEWVRGTLKVQAHFYPSPLAEIQGALEALEREPAAGFEQVASTTSANALILQNLKMPGSPFNPMAEKQARKRLQAGLQRLGAFECQDPVDKDAARGFDWFADGAPNDAMTTLGLLHLRDIAKVYYVDGDLLDRTDEFVRYRRDRFGAMPPPVHAYALWALTANGHTADLAKQLAALRKQAMLQRDPYVLALAALSHENAKRQAETADLLKEIAALQNPEGVVAGARTSITGSQGRDLDVETTALAVLGWLPAERGFEFNANIQGGVKWLHQQRRGAGSYGGTQATSLALKAMLANYKTQQDRNPRLFTGGEVRVTMLSPQAVLQPGDAKAFDDGNGGPTNVVPFSQRSQERITIALDNAQAFQPGANRVQLAVTNNNTMPYTLTWSYRATKSSNDPKAPIKLSTKLDKTEAREGDAVKLSAVVENASGKALGMTVAVLGLPAGLSLPDDAAQRKALAGAGGKIDSWEIRGRELVLYWRELPAGAKIPLEVDLTCHLPGAYRGPPSRAYLVYDADQPYWAEPLQVRIAAKQ